MRVEVTTKFPKARRAAPCITSPRNEYWVLIVRIHQTRDVLHDSDRTPNGAEGPPGGPKSVDIRQQNAVSCQCGDPPVGSRTHSLIAKSSLIVDFLENRFTHELRDGRGLILRQVLVENLLIRQHKIEILNKTPIAVAGATKVFTPRFQAEWEQVDE